MDHTPEEAIRQIRDKQYALRFQPKLGEKPKYTGRILAVGIAYDKEQKKHSWKRGSLQVYNMAWKLPLFCFRLNIPEWC